MIKVRAKAPKGTIHTQLRPGHDDYIPWIKVKYPDGPGRYIEKKISKFDPDNTAAKFFIKGEKPTKETEQVLDSAMATSSATLTTLPSDATEDLASDVNLTEENPDDENSTPYKTIENKKKRERSSPGEQSNTKKYASRDDAIVADLYREMGLQRFLEA